VPKIYLFALAEACIRATSAGSANVLRAWPAPDCSECKEQRPQSYRVASE